MKPDPCMSVGATNTWVYSELRAQQKTHYTPPHFGITTRMLDLSTTANVLTAAVTLIGVMASLWFSTKALREVQIDRKLRSRPYLSFEPGGYLFPITFKTIGPKLHGKDPIAMKEIFGYLPADGESIVMDDRKSEDGRWQMVTYGTLRNHGSGPALNICITWKADKIYMGFDTFDIDDKKINEPLYNHDLNTWPSLPRNLHPAEDATLNCIPAVIVKDYDRKIKRIDGHLVIKCTDVYGDLYEFTQGFHLFTEYERSHLHVTFYDEE